MEAALRDRVAEGLGLNPATVQVSARAPEPHQSNALYDIFAGRKHYLAKVFLNPVEQVEAAWREYRALRLVGPLGLGPRPLAHFVDLPKPVVVYEFVPGTVWGRTSPTPAALRQLAASWMLLHTLPTTGLEPAPFWQRPLREVLGRYRTILNSYTDWSARHYPAARPAAQQLQTALDRAAPSFTALENAHAPQRFCRVDARFANFISLPDGRVALLDWEDSGLADPARDLADLLTHPNQEDVVSPTAWHAFLDPYLATLRAQDPTLAARATHAVVVAGFFWITLILERGLRRWREHDLSPWVMNDLTPATRLRRYLARIHATLDQQTLAADSTLHLGPLAELMFFPAPEPTGAADGP